MKDPGYNEKNKFNIPSLDGIRAVSIVIVFLSHAGLYKVIPGLFGVTVFFFLSGYLITTLLRIEYVRSGTISLRDFYIRRALRIFPPFYFVLFGTLILTALQILPGDIDWIVIGTQAMHMANYQEIFGVGTRLVGTEVLWSLAVEEHFYLIFPFFYIILCKWLPNPRQQFYVLIGLITIVLAWMLALVYVWYAPSSEFLPRISHGTDTRFDALLFGCALAVYGNPILDDTRIKQSIWIRIYVPLSLFGLAISFLIRDPWFRETLRYTVQGISLIAIFIAAIRFPTHIFFRFLNWPWVRYLGVLSYPLYLTHVAVIVKVKQIFSDNGWDGQGPGQLVMQLGLALLVSIAISALIHHAIERPCTQLRKKFSHMKA